MSLWDFALAWYGAEAAWLWQLLPIVAIIAVMWFAWFVVIARFTDSPSKRLGEWRKENRRRRLARYGR